MRPRAPASSVASPASPAGSWVASPVGSWVASWAVLAVVAVAAVGQGGCAGSRYHAQVVARGELVLRYDGGFEMFSAGRRVARAPGWGGLERHVRCVPVAREHARGASSRGAGAVVFSTLGAIFGLGGFTALVALYDRANPWSWVGIGAASAVSGLVFALVGRALRTSSNGHAVDAMNLYNDAVGSLGATCDDLTYPAPAGDVPPPPPPPSPAIVVPPPPPPDAAQGGWAPQ